MEPLEPRLFKPPMKRLNRTGLVGRLAVLVLSVFTVSACATRQAVDPPPIPPLLDRPAFDIESVDLLEMSKEMQQFVDTHLKGSMIGDTRAFSLAYAMLDPYLLDFTYDPHVTLTAKEAFRTRRGNCLTFSNMFIAMARAAGLDAWYREVEIEPEWSSIDDTLLVSLHVNAATRERGKEYIIDVSRRQPREGERHRRISDKEAEAQFYNNLGANALVANDLSMAYAYFRKADETLPGLAYIWSNMGVVFNRNGQVDDAIKAYKTAMALDDRHTVSLNNLYTIYLERGDIEEAIAFQQEVERNRRRNPYYLHHLAQEAFAEKQLDDAMSFTRQAIRMENREYRFFYTMAQLHYQAGDIGEADSNLLKAQSLAPDWVDTTQLTLPGEIPEPAPY